MSPQDQLTIAIVGLVVNGMLQAWNIWISHRNRERLRFLVKHNGWKEHKQQPNGVGHTPGLLP